MCKLVWFLVLVSCVHGSLQSILSEKFTIRGSKTTEWSGSSMSIGVLFAHDSENHRLLLSDVDSGFTTFVDDTGLYFFTTISSGLCMYKNVTYREVLKEMFLKVIGGCSRVTVFRGNNLIVGCQSHRDIIMSVTRKGYPYMIKYSFEMSWSGVGVEETITFDMGSVIPDFPHFDLPHSCEFYTPYCIF